MASSVTVMQVEGSWQGCVLVRSGSLSLCRASQRKGSRQGGVMRFSALQDSARVQGRVRSGIARQDQGGAMRVKDSRHVDARRGFLARLGDAGSGESRSVNARQRFGAGQAQARPSPASRTLAKQGNDSRPVESGLSEVSQGRVMRGNGSGLGLVSYGEVGLSKARYTSVEGGL